jgi:hypothetical protein
MPAKVKEIKDDAIISIDVNRNYYLMLKNTSLWITKQLNIDDPEELKSLMTKKFEDLSDPQKSFYTLVLLLAEIESKANDQDALQEKEILLPGDEGYEPPVVNED